MQEWFLHINTLNKQYTEDVVAKGILGNEHHDYIFYKSMDIWWYFNSNVMKYVLASTNDFTIPITHIEGSNITTTYMENAMEVSNSNDMKPLNKKLKVQDIASHIYSMAENSVF